LFRQNSNKKKYFFLFDQLQPAVQTIETDNDQSILFGLFEQMSPQSPLLAIFSAIGVLSLIIVWYKTKNAHKKSKHVTANNKSSLDSHSEISTKTSLRRQVAKQHSIEASFQTDKETAVEFERRAEVAKNPLKHLAPKLTPGVVEPVEERVVKECVGKMSEELERERKEKARKERLEQQRLEMVGELL
jgi:hypothetical protein